MDQASRSSLVADGFDLKSLEREDAHHAAGLGVGRRLHRLSASTDDLQSVLKAQGAGKGQGRVFAEAQAGRRGATVDAVGSLTLRDSSAAKLAT